MATATKSEVVRTTTTVMLTLTSAEASTLADVLHVIAGATGLYPSSGWSRRALTQNIAGALGQVGIAGVSAPDLEGSLTFNRITKPEEN